MRNTPLEVVWRDMEESVNADGSHRTFSIGFVTKLGKFVYFRKARRTGTVQNQRLYDYIGVEPLSQTGKPIDHIHPVYIHSIIFYQGNITYNQLRK